MLIIMLTTAQFAAKLHNASNNPTEKQKLASLIDLFNTSEHKATHKDQIEYAVQY